MSFFSKFPEVLLIDSMYSTNRNKYKLFSVMVKDSCGRGQFVNRSLVDSESKVNLQRSIAQLKATNPQWTRVRVVVTDKDIAERDAIQREFPAAQLILCQFHVIWYLSKVTGSYFTAMRAAKKRMK